MPEIKTAMKKLDDNRSELDNSTLVGYISFIQKINYTIDVETQLDDIIRCFKLNFVASMNRLDYNLDKLTEREQLAYFT